MIIYCITNLVNDRKYVGRTSLALSARWSGHKSNLRTGRHTNEVLKVDWDRFGEESFVCKQIEALADRSLADSRERFWVKNLNAYYNLEKLDRKSRLPGFLTPKEIADMKRIAASVGCTYLSEGSFYELIQGLLSGAIVVSRK